MGNYKVAILGSTRTPIGSLQGDLSEHSAVSLGALAIKGAVKKSKIDLEHIDEVFMGCVLPAGLKQSPARQALIAAGLPESTGGATINKVCGSGMQASR